MTTVADTIKKMLEIIPAEEAEFRAALQGIAADIFLELPEDIAPEWFFLSDCMERHFPPPNQAKKWHMEAAGILENATKNRSNEIEEYNDLY